MAAYLVFRLDFLLTPACIAEAEERTKVCQDSVFVVPIVVAAAVEVAVVIEQLLNLLGTGSCLQDAAFVLRRRRIRVRRYCYRCPRFERRSHRCLRGRWPFLRHPRRAALIFALRQCRTAAQHQTLVPSGILPSRILSLSIPSPATTLTTMTTTTTGRLRRR